MTRQDAASSVWDDDFGGLTAMGRIATPYSNAAEHLEAIISGYSSREEMLKSFAADQRGNKIGQPIPASILSAMKLAEYFCEVEGDLWQTIEIPADIGLQGLQIEGTNADTFKQLYDEMEMSQAIEDIWLTTEIYGNAFPYTIWDETPQIVTFDPKYVQVGEQPFASYSITGDLVAGLEQNLRTHRDEAVYKELTESLFPNVNEKSFAAGLIPLPADRIRHIRARGVRFWRYTLPPLARIFRTISTRQVLEEMIRATIEGMRNQLWVFKLGDVEHQPRPGEITALRNVVNASSGQRTGALVWSGNLVVEQHAPKVDAALANDKWQMLTRHIFRQRGIAPSVVSGEYDKSGGGSQSDLDVQLVVMRVERQRENILRYLRWFNAEYMKHQGKSATAQKELPTLRYERPAIELSDLIKNRLMPLVTAGLLSDTTALSESGHAYDVELGNKKKEKVNAEMFAPKPSFAQMTVNPNTPEKQANTDATRGRTPDAQANPTGKEKGSAQAPRKMGLKASDLTGNQQKIVTLYDTTILDPKNGEDRAKFFAGLKSLIQEISQDGYQRGYVEGEGRGDPDPHRMDQAGIWSLAFMSFFAQDMAAGNGSPAQWRRRAAQYGLETERRALGLGLQQAAQEDGYTLWHRVLGPDPCPVCARDSGMLYSINTPWFEFHPDGACGASVVFNDGVRVKQHTLPIAQILEEDVQE